MGLESSTYINGLVPTNPLGSDNQFEGDDHIRLLKSTIKNTFPNIAGAVTPTHAEINFLAGVTSGVQAQLDAANANVPAGNISATTKQGAINELDAEKVSTSDIGTTVQAYDADLDTVASAGVGTGANQIVQLDGSAGLPAVDGSKLTGMTFGSRTINTPTRAIATTYTASASDIYINIEMTSTGGQSIYELLVDGVSRYKSSQAVGVGGTMILNAVVPKGSTYKLQAVFSTASLNSWVEYQ